MNFILLVLVNLLFSINASADSGVNIGPKNLESIFGVKALDADGDTIEGQWCQFNDPSMYLILNFKTDGMLLVNTLTASDRFADAAIWEWKEISNNSISLKGKNLSYDLNRNLVVIERVGAFQRCKVSFMYDVDTQL